MSVMNAPSLPPGSHPAVTQERLRLLSLGFFISGAIGAVTVSFLLIHLTMLVGFSLVPESTWHSGPAKPGHEGPPLILFRILAAMLALIILLGWLLGGLTAYAGRCIARREHRVFVLVMAAINCLWIPYGTLLGVTALLFLSSSEAREAFKAQPGSTAGS